MKEKLRAYLDKSIFYANQNPKALEQYLMALTYPKVLAENISLPAKVTVDNGALIGVGTALLPTKIVINDGVHPAEVDVAWGTTSTPAYNAATAGDYVVAGTISGLPAFLSNSGNKTVLGTITVMAKVATPVADPVAGEIVADAPITLTSATEGALIYYTLDDSTPTNESTLYEEPITFDEPTTVKAIAYKAGMTKSDVLSAAYTIAS
jgi:hypothetical protein